MQSVDGFCQSRLLLTFFIVSIAFFSNGAQAVWLNKWYIWTDIEGLDFQVTLKEFQHTLKIVHDTCQTVTKVEEELIQQVRDGTFVDDPVIKVDVKNNIFMWKIIFLAL